jgi:hypothetical protein
LLVRAPSGQRTPTSNGKNILVDYSTVIFSDDKMVLPSRLQGWLAKDKTSISDLGKSSATFFFGRLPDDPGRSGLWTDHPQFSI